jgi:rhodanese-related sulfurtransferase
MIAMTTKRQHKDRLYNLFAQVGKALCNPKRLELVDLLVQAPRTVEELATETQMSIANTSQHLQRLKQAHLVEAERDGSFKRYRLTDPLVGQLWHTLQLVAQQQLAEVEQALDAYRDRRHEFERVSAQELQARLQADDVVLIDVRPEVEYQNGHLPDALSIPLSEIEQGLASLPDDKMIVAYCRGTYCVMADEALAILADKGWAVARLEDGVVERALAGHLMSWP